MSPSQTQVAVPSTIAPKGTTAIPPIADFSPKNNPYLKVFDGGYTLSNLKTVLGVARANGFGVLAVNIRSTFIIDAALEAAWTQKSPIILECAETENQYCNMMPEILAKHVHDRIPGMLKKYGYSVPVVLHQDHVQKDLNMIKRAVESGYSSAEADLSKKPLEENSRLCADVVRMCHPLGVSVEVEEGEIGATDALLDPDLDVNLEKYITKTADAYALCAATRPDAIAIFVGNGHGKYLKKPRIAIDRIKEVAEAVAEFGTKVVLHGSSYLDIEVFNAAVKAGAAKFNYATAVSDVFFDHLPADFLAEMDKTAEEKKTARRKVLYLFEEKIAALPKEVLAKTVRATADHIAMMMQKAVWSAGKADLYK